LLQQLGVQSNAPKKGWDLEKYKLNFFSPRLRRGRRLIFFMTNLIRRYIILGERQFSHYIWTSIIFLGGLGFLIKGLSNSDDIPLIPQGILMSFYGSIAVLVSLYWSFLIFWNVGGGFNELNKKEGFVRLFRWGYPGKNRRIDFSYPLKDVQAIKVELNPERTIYLKLKGKREIPLTGGGGETLTLKELEKQASELANYLQVSLEGI
jgi:hypothetical protein